MISFSLCVLGLAAAATATDLASYPGLQRGDKAWVQG